MHTVGTAVGVKWALKLFYRCVFGRARLDCCRRARYGDRLDERIQAVVQVYPVLKMTGRPGSRPPAGVDAAEAVSAVINGAR